MEKETTILERVKKIPLEELMENVWPIELCLMRDCNWIAFWEHEEDTAYTQNGQEDFEGFVKRVIAKEIENEKPDEEGFMYLNVDFAIAEAECNRALNPQTLPKPTSPTMDE